MQMERQLQPLNKLNQFFSHILLILSKHMCSLLKMHEAIFQGGEQLLTKLMHTPTPL
jgi:hypothetical protein